jgi:hypothetical protein
MKSDAALQEYVVHLLSYMLFLVMSSQGDLF